MRRLPKMVMLDRDGVINRESALFIKSVAEWHPLPGAIDAIVRLQRRGIKVAVCTNQSGIARRILRIEDLDKIHIELSRVVCAAGGDWVPVFFCPHHPEDGCLCRKPRPLMLRTALHQADIAPEDACFVGDRDSDLLAATAAGCRPVLLNSPNVRLAAGKGSSKGPQRAFVSLADYVSSLFNLSY